MSRLTVMRMEAANYPYQKERANALERVLAAILVQHGPLRVSRASLAVVDGPTAPQISTTDDPQTHDLGLSVKERCCPPPASTPACSSGCAIRAVGRSW